MDAKLDQSPSSFDLPSNTYSTIHIEDIPGESHELRPLGTDDSRDVKASWRSLFISLKKSHTPTITFAFTTTFISACVKPASAVFLGKIFSILTKFGAGTLEPKQCLHDIGFWCIALVCLGALSWLIEAFFFSSWVLFGELQAKSIRLQMFEGMLNKSMEWYDLRQDGVGALMIRIQTQIRELQLAVSQPLGFLAYEVIGVGTAIGLAFYFSWKMTLVVISTLPFAGALLYFVSLRLSPAIEAQKRELTQASKYANTAITNINTVKAYNGQEQEVWQYGRTIQRVALSYMAQARANAFQGAIIKFMVIALFVQGFGFGLYLVDNGVDPGHILTTFYACLNALQAVEVVLPQWLVLTKGMSAGATLESIMFQIRNGRRVTTMTGSYKPVSCLGDVEINKVSFTYPTNPKQSILNEVTFFFPAGETTFIVGSSGSGKSTVGSLLMKYYDPSIGEILIDGNPLKVLDLDWLRRNITLVQQQSVLFDETILQNIAFGRELPPTIDDIVEACKTADLEQTLRDLPKGLETVAGLKGQELSGGQQQRIAIARARLRDAPILILDEATSALDAKSREKVMTEIRKWRRGKTTMIITHDISQIDENDYVYVLQQGNVVQEGFCSSLANKKFGALAALIAATQSPEIPPTEQRRSSEPASPTSPSASSFDELLQPGWNSVSRPLGIPNSPPRLGARVNRTSILLGVGAAQASSMWTENIWTSPVIRTTSSFETERLNYRRSISNPFASPESLSSRRFSHQSPTQITPEKVAHPISNQATHLGGIEPPQPRVSDAGISTPYQEAAFQNITQPETPFPVELAPPLKPLKKPATLSAIFRTIWPNLTWRERAFFVSGFSTALTLGASTPAFAYVFTQLLQVYYLPSNRGLEARKWALILLAVGVIDAASMFCMHYALEYSGQAWVNKLRVEALKRIFKQPRSWFDKERNSAANLNGYLDRNAEEMRNLIGRFAGPIFTTFWMLSISIIWSMAISWKLTLVAMVCVPAMYGLIRVFDIVSGKWEEKCNQASEYTGSIFTEAFTNIRVIRALTLEGHFRRKHQNAAIDTYNTGIRRAIYAGACFGLGDTMSYIITASVFYYGTVIITNGEHDVTTVLQVVNLLIFGIANAMGLLMLVPQLNSSRTAATYMLHLANLPLHNTSETTGNTRLKTPFPITFTNLSFTYPSRSRSVLQDITLTIHPGTCTAIVGPSGSGKSTIASLLLGLYHPDQAPVDKLSPLSYAGVPIALCHLPSLRNQISIVAQQPLLFPCSILSNIIYGLPEGSPFANLDSAIQAARDSGIHDFVMSLPNGYETVVGEGGMGLSGGQAQRIAIARALVRRPKLLILDEATSALDAVSAEGIRYTVRKLVEKGVAVMIISHAVEMMRICDQVVMIEDGKLVEKGGFEELRSRGGKFAGLIGSKKREERGVGLGMGMGVDIERLQSPVTVRNRQNWFRKASY